MWRGHRGRKLRAQSSQHGLAEQRKMVTEAGQVSVGLFSGVLCV